VNKFVKYILVGLVSVILLTGAFSGGFVAGHFSSRVSISSLPGFSLPVELPQPVATPDEAAKSTPTDLQNLFTPFWEAWDLVHTKYVDQPVDDTKLMQGAIRGMLASLGDEHTSYMTPQDYKTATQQLSGEEYEGIGAYVNKGGEYLKIVNPMPDSPAEKAGLKPGDLIVGIDGADMTGVDLDVVHSKVLGPAGSDVILTIMRETVEKPFDVKITRAKITASSVVSEMRDNGIGYIRLYTFGDKTVDELNAALKNLMAQKPKGLILDLRNNGGGYLFAAVEVSSQFIAKGVVVSEKYGDDKIQEINATPGGLATAIPLVVLVNEYSASASEIVAGAIQDYGRGKLVGVTTYGKGSVQQWLPLKDEQGAARITIAKWLTPKGNTIDKVGLTPDVVAEMTQEDYDAGLDPQLDAAIKTLLEMLK